MSKSVSNEAIETLAAEIGDVAYLDIAKWHLDLAHAHLHSALAEKIYPLLLDRTFSRAKLTALLGEMVIEIGAGKRSIPLLDFIPDRQVERLYQAIDDYQAKL